MENNNYEYEFIPGLRRNWVPEITPTEKTPRKYGPRKRKNRPRKEKFRPTPNWAIFPWNMAQVFVHKYRPKNFFWPIFFGPFFKEISPNFFGLFFRKNNPTFFGRFFRKNHPHFWTNFFGKITQKFFKKRKNCPEYRATLSLHNPLRIWRLVRGLSFLYGERNLQFSCFARSTLRT